MLCNQLLAILLVARKNVYFYVCTVMVDNELSKWCVMSSEHGNICLEFLCSVLDEISCYVESVTLMYCDSVTQVYRRLFRIPQRSALFCLRKTGAFQSAAARSKAWVSGPALAGIVGSNSTGVMDVCLLYSVYIVR
jgi:hypothetical protein